MNWNTDEGIEMQSFFGIHMNEFEDIRMNWGSGFFWGGRHTNELEDIRLNWKTYE